MLSLILNERRKLYKQKSTMIMVLLLSLIIIGTGFFAKYDENRRNVPEDWKEELLQENKESQEMMKDEKLPSSVKYQLQKDIDLNNYRIENNQEPSAIWNFMNATVYLVEIISIFAIIVAAGSISKEFSWGTIKLLMIRPVSRTKILLSKYLSTFVYVIELLLLLFILSFLIGGILFGFDHINTSILTYSEGKVLEENPVLYILKSYGLNSISLFIMTTFAFMISTLFRSSALAIGLSITLTFVGSTIVGIFAKYEWVKYILFTNVNLNQYIDGSQVLHGMTMKFSIIMLLIYYVMFILLTWIPFKKRDIAG
ncbi:ABC transporter permease [Fredinandcohnia humi]